MTARVAAAQDHGPGASGEQEPRERRHSGCLTAAADREVADADDRDREPLPHVRAAGEPRAPRLRELPVGGAEQVQRTTRNGRTTAERGGSGGRMVAMAAIVLSFAPRF